MAEDNPDYLAGTPRLYIEDGLAENTTLALDDKAAHYLKNVLRRADGSILRVFNGRDGEYLARLKSDRKNASLEIARRVRLQTKNARETHLVFTPIKKDRLDFMIEKSVELGVTHLHPVLTHQTSVRDMNFERIEKQIIEACEQCERLDIPSLSPLASLDLLLKKWPDSIPLYAALERANAEFLGHKKMPVENGILIGPEGGFSAEEKSLLLAHEKITPVSLGDNILRAETAAIFGLSLLLASKSFMPE